MARKEKTYSSGDTLYHPLHGMCIVRGIEKNSGLGGDCYRLEQKDPDKSRAKFTVLVAQIHTAGFHEPMTLKTANQLLDFWKNQDSVKKKTGAGTPENFMELEKANSPEAMAEILWIFARRKVQDKFSAEERKLFKYSTNMLVRELAYVWQIPEEDALSRVCKELKFDLPALSLTK